MQILLWLHCILAAQAYLVVSQESCPLRYDPERSEMTLRLDWAVGKPGLPGRTGQKGEVGPRGPSGGGSRVAINSLIRRLEQLESTVENLKEECQSGMENEPWKTADNGYKYLVSELTMNYDNAKVFCKKRQSTLAAKGPREPSTRQFIHSLVQAHDILWIGFTDSVTEGEWVWADGVRSTSSNTAWRINAPDNYGGIEHYGAMTLEGVGDVPRSRQYRALCEKSA